MFFFMLINKNPCIIEKHEYFHVYHEIPGIPQTRKVEIPMILFDPIAITQALHAGTEALRATVNAPATLLQVDRGPLAVSVATGVSDYDTNAPATANQTFEIGSQTKLMTAVAILQLVEDGKIGLDAPAAAYLPAATIAGIANADTATVRQLLNMTAGIDNYTEVRDADGVPLFIKALLENPDQIFGPEQALDLARGLPALAAPGAEYIYSNTNYTLLGQIVEAQTGKTFFDVLKDGVFTPAGMNDTVRQRGTDDPRLSSYLADQTGALVDVTRAPWEMRGEAGIASTTTDMVAFLKALFVDKTLLGDAALAEMTQYIPTGTNDTLDTGFGLGLVKIGFIGGDTYLGFTGGTLGTSASTYLNIDTGNVISAAGTSADLDTVEATFPLLQSLDALPGFNLVDDGSPLRFMSGSASAVQLTPGDDGLAFAMDGATLTLDRDLRATTTASVSFADGSVIVVGDNAAGTLRDDRGNTVDILKHHRSAADQDNQLIGLGGDDVLKAGRGDDKLLGGTGHDALWGRAGDDVLSGDQGNDALYGGTGNDRLTGGAGRDVLHGGAGADQFIFTTTEDSGTGRQRDIIQDFRDGQDKIDLTALFDGGESSALTWRGRQAFTGTEGEIRVQYGRHASTVMLDIDGDGRADMEIVVQGNHQLTASDFLL
jgi:D-alanyl-D-alanine carboxypeptidase